MSDFEKELHAMFDHIWDCEIDHPVYQDTVGELMEAVIQTYEKHKPTLGTNLAEVGTDLISRQIAQKLFGEALTYQEQQGKLTWTTSEVKQWIADFIEDLPSAQPEPKRGKWERHYCKDGNPDGWQCDKCKEWYYFGQTLPNFCPNCGADMRGEQDG